MVVQLFPRPDHTKKAEKRSAMMARTAGGGGEVSTNYAVAATRGLAVVTSWWWLAEETMDGVRANGGVETAGGDLACGASRTGVGNRRRARAPVKKRAQRVFGLAYSPRRTQLLTSKMSPIPFS